VPDVLRERDASGSYAVSVTSVSSSSTRTRRWAPSGELRASRHGELADLLISRRAL